jgi:hypothetical protein
MLTSFSLHEPSNEARQTIDSILVEGTYMKLMPTHCINAAGELEGFQLVLPGKAKGGILRIDRTMLHGTSLFEVNLGQLRLPNNIRGCVGMFNQDIMRPVQTTDTRASMQTLMQTIAGSSLGAEATFHCVPENVDLLKILSRQKSGIPREKSGFVIQANFNTMRHKGRDSVSGIGRILWNL